MKLYTGMEKKNNTRIAFLMAAITLLSMIPAYYFIMAEFSGWRKWLPLSLFAVLGVLALLRYFKK